MSSPAILNIGQEFSPPPADDYQAASARLRDACQDAWMLIDQLGPHASDEHKLDVLRGPKFASAAFSVCAALVLTRNLTVRTDMYRTTTPYTPGPGDLMGQYTGHPHDPRTPDPDDDDATKDVINDVRQFLDMAETAASKGDWKRAKQALIEARMSLEELAGDEQ